MPTALADFRASLSIAQEVLKLEASYSDPPGPGDALIVQGLRGGATVLMVAAFEDFLQSAFLEHLSRLDGIPPPVRLAVLPDVLQVTSIFSSLDRALSGPRYSDTTKAQRLHNVRSAAQRLVDERIDPLAMSESGNNPNANNIKALFKSIGLPSIFDVVKPKYEARAGSVAQTYLSDRLDHIVRNRHVVAHTGNALNISRKDLAEWIAFVDLLAELLDTEIDSLVGALLSPKPAPTGAGPGRVPRVGSPVSTASSASSGTATAPSPPVAPWRRVWQRLFSSRC